LEHIGVGRHGLTLKGYGQGVLLVVLPTLSDALGLRVFAAQPLYFLQRFRNGVNGTLIIRIVLHGGAAHGINGFPRQIDFRNVHYLALHFLDVSSPLAVPASRYGEALGIIRDWSGPLKTSSNINSDLARTLTTATLFNVFGRLGEVPVNANNHTDVELFRHKGATIGALTPSQFDKGSVSFGFGFDTERIVLKPDNISLANFGHIHFGHLSLHHLAGLPNDETLAQGSVCVNRISMVPLPRSPLVYATPPQEP
jgi:hypothetical protein